MFNIFIDVLVNCEGQTNLAALQTQPGLKNYMTCQHNFKEKRHLKIKWILIESSNWITIYQIMFFIHLIHHKVSKFEIRN